MTKVLPSEFTAEMVKPGAKFRLTGPSSGVTGEVTAVNDRLCDIHWQSDAGNTYNLAHSIKYVRICVNDGTWKVVA